MISQVVTMAYILLRCCLSWLLYFANLFLFFLPAFLSVHCKVIRMALGDGALTAAEVSTLEMHGTGALAA